MHLADQIMFSTRHRLLVGVALVLALMFWAGRTLLPGWQLFWQQNFASAQLREAAVWLPDFQVDIDALPVVADLANLSGLTFDPERRTLFAITNSHPEIIELSLDGRVLRRIPVVGLEDPEAIEYLAPSLYVVADDPMRDDALPLKDLSSLHFDAASGHLMALSDESRQIVELDRQGRPVSRLILRGGRHGLQASVPQAEGMAMDDQGRLYVVSEPNLFYRFARPHSAGSEG